MPSVNNSGSNIFFQVPLAKIMNHVETKSFLLSLSYSRIQEGVNICLGMLAFKYA